MHLNNDLETPGLHTCTYLSTSVRSVACMLAGILYASKESHYSVFKAARMYRIPVVKVRVACTAMQHFVNSAVKNMPCYLLCYTRFR
jgi:hypothetical protein